MPAGLLTPSKAYKPHRYPWAFDYWKLQQQLHWMPEEVPLGEDCKDWAARLTEAERSLLTQIFRFFTQADIDVNDNYMERYSRVFKPTEVKMMLSAFSNMETVHIAAYSLLLDTVGMAEGEYGAFMDYKAMRDKHDYMSQFGAKSHGDLLTTLACFGAFGEGLQLFASFAMLMNFPRFGKMKGMGQIVSWSVRDESLHCDGIIKLFHTLAAETGALSLGVQSAIMKHCSAMVDLEDRFIDLAFGMGEIEGLDPRTMKQYIRFIADWRLGQLGLGQIYGVTKNPLPWLQVLLSGQEHANFFETRATEYSKATSLGDWGSTWAMFDERSKA